MIDQLRTAELAKKVGGRFKLTALIQKRLRELMEGSRPLVENTDGLTQIEIVVKEILEDKITIKPEEAGSEELA